MTQYTYDAERGMLRGLSLATLATLVRQELEARRANGECEGDTEERLVDVVAALYGLGDVVE